MSKNIEYVQSEVVGAEIVETATDSSKLGDLITEAWATQYARSTGLPVAQPAVQVETEVVELKALLLALLRAVWKTTCRLFNGHSLGEVFSAAVISNKSVDDAYEWLLGRLTKSYLPTPSLPQPQDAPHLVENLQAGLGGRTIYGGTDTGIRDGISLLRLLANYSEMGRITKLVDNTRNWTWDIYNQLDQFIGADYPYAQNLTEIWLGCNAVTQTIATRLRWNNKRIDFHLTYVTSIFNGSLIGSLANNNYNLFQGCHLYLDALTSTEGVMSPNTNGQSISTCGYNYLPEFAKGALRFGGAQADNYHNIRTKYIQVGCKGDKTDTITLFCHTTANTTITDIEIGEGACQNLTILNIEGLTAANIYSHILQRLKQDEADCGEGVTITLGATNLAKLEDEQHPEYASLLAELRTTYKYTFA